MAPPCLSSSQWRGRPPQRYKTPLASLEALTGAAFVISFDDVYGYWPRNLKQRWQLLPHTATACVRQCATRWKLLQFRSSRSCWWLSRRRVIENLLHRLWKSWRRQRRRPRWRSGRRTAISTVESLRWQTFNYVQLSFFYIFLHRCQDQEERWSRRRRIGGSTWKQCGWVLRLAPRLLPASLLCLPTSSLPPALQDIIPYDEERRSC